MNDYEQQVTLSLCDEYTKGGYNPEITFRKGNDTLLSECHDYLKSNIVAAIMDLHERIIDELDPKITPITIYAAKEKIKYGYRVIGDDLKQAISGMMYDDKSCTYLWIYIDETKLTREGRTGLNRARKKADNFFDFNISEGISGGWSFGYGAE